MKLFVDCLTVIEAEFGMHAERTCSIKTRLETTLWYRLLPGAVDGVMTLFANSEDEIMAAYTLTANELLQKTLRAANRSSQATRTQDSSRSKLELSGSPQYGLAATKSEYCSLRADLTPNAHNNPAGTTLA